MSEHTKGPWIHGVKDSVYRDGDRLIWTSKGPGHGTIGEASSYHANAVANARLMAMAPELFEKLEQIEAAWFRSPRDVALVSRAMEDVSEFLNRHRHPEA